MKGFMGPDKLLVNVDLIRLLKDREMNRQKRIVLIVIQKVFILKVDIQHLTKNKTSDNVVYLYISSS